MAYGATRINGIDEVQAFDTLRDLVRKVESGECRIVEMSLTQEAPETRDFRTMDGAVGRRMVVRDGAIEITIRVVRSDPLRAEPLQRDEAGRLRGDVGIPRDARTGQFGIKPFSQMSREEMMQLAGMTQAERGAIMDEIMRESATAAAPPEPVAAQAPVNPLNYGARKVDID